MLNYWWHYHKQKLSHQQILPCIHILVRLEPSNLIPVETYDSFLRYNIPVRIFIEPKVTLQPKPDDQISVKIFSFKRQSFILCVQSIFVYILCFCYTEAMFHKSTKANSRSCTLLSFKLLLEVNSLPATSWFMNIWFFKIDLSMKKIETVEQNSSCLVVFFQ